MKWALALSTLSLAAAAPVTLWPTEALENHGRVLASDRMTNSRLASVYSAHFFDTDEEVYSNIGAGTEIEFGIPSRASADILERKSCILKAGNPVVPSALAEKYSDAIRLFHCVTDEKEELTITVETGRPDGLNAEFFDKNRRTFFVDSAVKDTNIYMIYDTELAAKEGIAPSFDDSLYDYATLKANRDLQRQAAAAQQDSGNSADLAFKFTLAPLANKEYSAYHGDNRVSVLAAIISCFSRVNGIYLHELGVFLQLHENADLGICLSTDNSAACNIGNTVYVVYDAMDSLEDLGIPSDSYDIGHVMTTGSGGMVAKLGSLCDASMKAAGTTGLPVPETDVYFVDYVAHEIGHQLHGAHSYRDCRGKFDGQRSPVAGVEEGGGNSIMGYAGICDHNIQMNSDPYFNSINLQQMHEFIAGVAKDGECGTVIQLEKELPNIEVPAFCAVPVGNYFQLRGESDSTAAENTFFSWDRIDTGFEAFESTTLGKFRSWKPSKSQSRFFPNLYHLNYPSEFFAISELLPTEPRSMDFRFTERRLFKSDIIADNFAEVLVGDFTFDDTRVNFIDAEPIKMTRPVSGELFLPEQSFTVEWEGVPQAGITVEVMFAVNSMVRTDESLFDYSEDTFDLEWIKLGEAPIEDGQVHVTLPYLEGELHGNVMIRSSLQGDMDSCFFFDLATEIRIIFGPIKNENDNTSGEIAIGFLAVIAMGLAVVFAMLRRKNILADQIPSEISVPSEKEMQEVKKAPEGRVQTKNRMFSEDSFQV